ncbi:unnamed protein product [Rodentolepis nana]|uniref:FNIP_M domain-containing protein n=1 Tax=Rodentolepis nana TaxID=102285 RepID=A0A158QIX8_RODNA|nr:unnamed protein product [Rodentolepis nana]
MSFALLRRAFTWKKSIDEHQLDDFLKWFHTEGINNPGFISKLFRKYALRLIVIKKPNDAIIFDSSSGRDSRWMPSFGTENRTSTLADIAFGSFSLTPPANLKSTVKLHDLKSSRQLILTCVHYPTPKRVRTSNSACYVRKQSEITSSDFWSNSSLKHCSDAAIAVCALVNIDWAHSLVKPAFNSTTFATKATLPDELSHRFYMLFFEHFLQISVSFQTLSEVIRRALTTTNILQGPNDGINETINRAFMNFQRTFRDLCIPRLSRPVWSSLSLAYVAQSNSPTGLKLLPDNSYQKYPLNITSFPGQYEQLSNSFVKGCLCSLISKSMSKDRAPFLAQLVTGILMQHRGWISTVLPKSQNFSANMCSHESLSEGNIYDSPYGSGVDNTLLFQQLVQSGCDMSRHTCTQNSILNVCGTALATTVIYDNASGSGLQSQQHRDRLLALLYLSSYFLRSPNLLLQSIEDVPEMAMSDMYELEQRKRQSLQRCRGSSGGRRKSSSQLSASLLLGQRGGVVDIYDSGIASQEDLSAAMLHTLQQYSASAGSSPSHPPVGASSICLPGRLTNEQCRLAEVAAQALVSREFAAAAAAIANKQPTQQSQNPQQQYNNLSSNSSSMFSESASTTSKHYREHTWTTGMAGRNRKVINSLLNPSASSSVSGGGGEMVPPSSGSNSLYSPLTPSLSTGVPCFSASLSSPSSDPNDLTEIPLLIERTYLDRWDNCWCLGEGIGGAVLENHYCSNRKTSSDPTNTKVDLPSPVPVRYGSSVERYSSFDKDESVEVGTACNTDMESLDDGTPSSLGGGTVNDCSELTLHPPIGASVFEHYTSGLALQAITESPASFRPRLVDDLTSWLRFAPALHRRGIRPPPSLRASSRMRASVHTVQQQNPRNSYRCSALLVNADTGSVEVSYLKSSIIISNLTNRTIPLSFEPLFVMPSELESNLLTLRNKEGLSAQRQARSVNRRSSNSVSSSNPSTLTASSSLNFVISPTSCSSAAGIRPLSAAASSSTVVATDSSTDDEYSEAPSTENRTLVAAPLVVKLLESVKLMYDKSGGCSSLALQHLESGLRNICGLGCMLADLLIPSITSMESNVVDAVDVFKKDPELIARVIG